MTPYYSRNGITIYCGDCLEVMPQTEPGFVLITDIPYGVNLGEHRAASETRPGLLVKSGGYLDTLDNFKSVVVPAVNQALRMSIRGMVFAVPPNMWLLPPPNVIGGVFVSAAVGRNCWGWSNLIHCLLYGAAPELQKGAKQTAISNNDRSDDNGHPVAKPLSWMTWAVLLGATMKNVIIDPFMGSGTTLVAAQNEGRRAIGIELSEEYCKIAVDRLRQPSFFSIPDEPQDGPEQLGF